mmetsp:Transcript_28321/g.91344  ORF Transcript_28321/g.91344 Transcript_28321/m.91344 type:complete len:200 (-) Transcript_28321:22-621(-)
MPKKPIIARRPWVISLSFMSATYSGDFSRRTMAGSQPKSPGSPSFAYCFSRSVNSMAAQTAKTWQFAAKGSLTIAARGSGLVSSVGNWKISSATKPRVASIATRPCLISAARAQARSGSVSLMRKGSKPTSPIIVPSSFAGRLRNGIAADFSTAFSWPARPGADAGTEKADARGRTTRNTRAAMEAAIELLEPAASIFV